MKIWISGALGFMGREVASRAEKESIEIVGGIDVAQGDCAFPLYRSFDEAPVTGDVIIDFSRPDSLDSILRYAVSNNIPAVLCTTGYTDEQLEKIREASEKVAVFRSGNMSLGIALLCSLCKKAAKVLGSDYDVEIVEMHHNRKVDAPSGTALMLADAVKSARDEELEMMCSRHGRDSKRKPNEIGIHAVRGGTVTGEHEVMFLGASERISISHSAENRSLFATGALRAAAYMAGREPGLYNMDDVIGEL
ncbi:MAG: 4-hydroxy-tetrahydrodipicolinate reductase [Clostridia bacterium]|nr:4-hydroxy-tetrahydrodipicolinate reductase [Clostridia bacterium]